MTEIKTGVIVKDEMMKEVHLGQILRELEYRLPASHLRWETEDSKFTRFIMKIPTKVWQEVATVKKRNI